MPSRPASLLCVGEDLELSELRCAVLSRAGYHAVSAVVPGCRTFLQTEQFDLVMSQHS
jgi:hypothetical protein